MSTQSDTGKKVTVRRLAEMKRAKEKIACLTAYDASFAQILEKSGVDVVLVGDSLGMVIQGEETTLPVSVEDMLYHTQCVARGLNKSLLITDMPFLSFTTVDEAVLNAGLFMKQGGAHMVKLEGGADQAETVAALSRNGIPVCAHLGLQPQYVHKIGGYLVQGREQAAADKMLDDALTLQHAGADMMLLECVPEVLASKITEALDIPVIGIGASADCDGQILVLYDILDISLGLRPKFSKNFMASANSIEEAIQHYVSAVEQGEFPAAEHVFK
ncbi:MAG: 3-methyl-2-oxobutanoate hydroxymethyltransferase [Gammaproteobacteria bacterium]|jgi:3-methyl-2-oxobutanoate hydroxymethyltransferase|nr:3-methyl-2-oxobutanoate hydroxymethyltransferase [Gammaproteobacteria bacterium]